MKINLLLITTFLSIVIYAGVNFETGIVGTTKLNGSAGCVCHNLNNNESVNVWIDGPDSILVGDSSFYKIYLSGGSTVKGGFNVAVRFGTLNPADNTTYVDFDELTHSFPLDFPGDTVYWHFKYTAPDSIGTDTIYSVGNSTNGDGNPQVGDEWNFGENFVVYIVEEIIPVELTSFTASQNESKVFLCWSTASETNNMGFEVERADPLDSPNEGKSLDDWKMIGYVMGNGTTTDYNEYSFIDDITVPGTYRYRLRQIDFDGNYQYSNVIDIAVILSDFSLSQNHPNPFNPSTTIKFTVGNTQFITLKIYDVLGNEIATLVNEQMVAGNYDVEFSSDLIHKINNDGIASGVYLYQLRAGNYFETKKMLMIK